MKLYNTLSRSIEEIIPINPGKIGLYACGFTVYDYTHLGHLRKYSMDDVLVRALRHAGFEVKFVQNVTDVGHLASDADSGEDKLEKGAKKYGQSAWDVARRFEDYFFYSMDLMGNARPDVSCRATEHIEQQLAMVQELEKKGFTYVIDGDGVYFDTSKFPEYGELAGLNKEELLAGARVEMIEGKRNPTDFALWKFEREGENRAMVWPSPWHPRSFPGWHIECSAMGMHYLGDQFDIHTGGIDHIPVHHTNEIAQAEAATGKKPFVKYWVHHNHMHVDGVKMSKSLNNFFTIDDILKKGFAPMALRLLFLTTHYRSEMNFTWESLEGAQSGWERLVKSVAGWLAEQGDKEVDAVAGERVKKYLERFFAHMENDLQTSEAVSMVWELVKDGELKVSEKLALITEFDQVLGLNVVEAAQEFDKNNTQSKTLAITQLSAEKQTIIREREKARAEKNWQRADELRATLAEMGTIVTDGKDGQEIVEDSSS